MRYQNSTENYQEQTYANTDKDLSFTLCWKQISVSTNLIFYHRLDLTGEKQAKNLIIVELKLACVS